jgi:putative oxidoreductase
MKVIRNIETWGDTHHPKMLDLIRILLGLFLLLKGIGFLNHYPFLRDQIIRTNALHLSPDNITLLIHYVTLVHMIGGIFILLGLLTRLASLIQIPIVFGAVFFVNILSPYFNSELWLSILVLGLLTVFMVIGSGPLSIDNLLRNIIADDRRAETGS